MSLSGDPGGGPERPGVWSRSPGSQRGRLASIRTRDLTLGGAFRKTKKTWEPNIHAVRKPKDELPTETPVAPKREKRERDGRRKDSRGGRKARPQVIQSHSIFEQCPGVANYKPAGRHGARGPQSRSTSPLCRADKKEGKAEQDQLLSKLQRDDFIVDPELRNDSQLKPIALPLHQPSSAHRAASTAVGGALTADRDALPPLTAGLLTEWQRSEQRSLVRMLQELSVAGREELFFMQFPDCLPGTRPAPKSDLHPGAAAGKPSKKEGKSAHQEAGPVDGPPGLSQLPEGFLGKLRVRRSGKVELRLGDVILDVSEGAASSFLQQLVSVRVSGGRSGNLTVLGNVHHKLVLSPDFQSLLRQAAAQLP